MAETQERPGLAEQLWQRHRGVVPVAGAGLALTAGTAVVAAFAGVPQSVTLPHWLGPWPQRMPGQLTGWVAAGILLLGALCLLWTWLAAPLLAPGLFGAGARPGGPLGGMRARTLALVAGAWSLPFLVAGPIGSLDVQSYAAIGRLAASGLNPYQVSPSWLTDSYGAAVDPLWRWTPTPYGPLQVAAFRGAAMLAGHHVGLAVLLLRAMAVLGAVAAVALAMRATPASGRAPLFVVTALSPVVLIHVVSGAHSDVFVGALAVLVVVLARADRPALAMVAAVLACALKLPGTVLVAFVLLDLLRRAPQSERARSLGRAVGAGLAVVAAIVAVCPDPFGWVPALRVPGIVRNGSAPSTWTSYVLGALTGHLSGQPLDHSFTVGRAFVAVVGVAVVVALLWRATSGPRGAAFHGLGWALIVLALSGPSLYPWYLTWGLFAAAAGSGPRGRLALIGLGSVTCLFSAMSPSTLPVVAWLVAMAGVLAFTGWVARGVIIAQRTDVELSPAGPAPHRQPAGAASGIAA
jgi:hypothetical protein